MYRLTSAIHPDDDCPGNHITAGPHPPMASILPKRMDREQLKRLESALREIAAKEITMRETHTRTFTEHRSAFSGLVLFTAQCSCGWTGTSAPTKAKAGKGWHRHHEAITGRKAAA